MFHPISETTIHGMAVKRICSNGYTAEMLNEALQNDLLTNRQIKPNRILSTKDKRKGNLKRYPAGSVAEFKKTPDDMTTYFFVGMSAFNSDLHPETSDEEYMVTVQSLIEHCNSRSQRFPVYMPIIGTHGRNNKKSERELLEYMVSAFRLNKHLINTDIHTVIREFSANYYCEPHDGCAWQDKDRYCVLVKWSDFENSPGTYIDEAFEKRSADVAGRIKIKNLR